MNGVLLNVDVENSTRQKLSMDCADGLWVDTNRDKPGRSKLAHDSGRTFNE